MCRSVLSNEDSRFKKGIDVYPIAGTVAEVGYQGC